MSAPHMSAKEVRRRYRHVIDGGNCRWQHLTEHICLWERVGYNAGLYGWNYDIYEIDGDTCLVTGDRPPDGNVALDPARMRAYEAEAQVLLTTSYRADYTRKRAALARKVTNYIRKTIEGGEGK